MNKKAFTLVELVVVIVILGILSSIGIISYVSYLGNARDTQRRSDVAQLSSALRLHKQQKGSYPLPGASFNLTYISDANVLAFQGKMNSEVQLSNIDRLPLDPKLDIPYVYSVTNNRQEYQLALSLENSDIPIALVEGNYKSVSINNLPSIILAVDRTVGSEADISVFKNTFVLSDQMENLPYTFEEPFSPISNSESITELVNNLKGVNLYWQNSDFQTCEQIELAGKELRKGGTDEYQILNNSGQLVNQNCNFVE